MNLEAKGVARLFNKNVCFKIMGVVGRRGFNHHHKLLCAPLQRITIPTKKKVLDY